MPIYLNNMKKTASLDELTIQYLERQLRAAIDINDKASIAEYLRKLICIDCAEAMLISKETLSSLAAYYESEKAQNKLYKSGPKPLTRERRLYEACALYHRLMTPNPLTGKRELAWLYLNSPKKAFALVENTALWNEEGDFSPQWKYPHMERERNSVPLPKDLDVKDYVCDLYGGIKQSTFDHALAEYRKKLKNIF